VIYLPDAEKKTRKPRKNKANGITDRSGELIDVYILADSFLSPNFPINPSMSSA